MRRRRRALQRIDHDAAAPSGSRWSARRWAAPRRCRARARSAGSRPSTSPSEKRPTVALPSSTPRCDAISCASAGLALPVNSTVLNSTCTPSRRRRDGRRLSAGGTGIEEDLAGEEGLEPSHVGIKIRCLNQLGDSPTQVRGFAPPTLETVSVRPSPASGCCVQTAAHSTDPARRQSSRRPCRRRAASPMPALANTALPEPVMRLLPNALSSHSSGLRHLGARGLGRRLQVVATEPTVPRTRASLRLQESPQV